MKGDSVFDDIEGLQSQLKVARTEAEALVTGLSEPIGCWRAGPASWSVADCLDHLASTNAIYMSAMVEPAASARRSQKLRRVPAKPGFLGRCFIFVLEPPVRRLFRVKAPENTHPRAAVALADACARFRQSQSEILAFLAAHADLDLVETKFPNPFFRGARVSIATGLHVIAAHERRHLWQARRIREAAILAR